ncbi:UdgX family uracil-DNA binding protein [uncultured Jatrophihabitans sp.]|uniref:UdgX family uracil-DNA binding protein n=1 Tax=uncultured Jatrophihabitans sp. TaxID=1610747 RepID=UPI0035CB9F31
MPTRAKHPGAAQFVPSASDLGHLAQAATGCTGCDLYENATQVVFGRGPQTARLVFVGEQPGDVEDTEGAPFVGPAGGVLDRALRDSGIERGDTYVTNAVKHFRWKAVRGSKRRIHEKPSAGQSTACRPWLAAELAAVRPHLVVALGATAAGSLFGASFRLTQHRGEALSWPPETGDFAGLAGSELGIEHGLATIHPSAVLRAEPDERQAAYDGLVADLQVARELLG